MRKNLNTFRLGLQKYKRHYLTFIITASGLSSLAQNNKENFGNTTVKISDTIAVNYLAKEITTHNSKPQYYINNIFFGVQMPFFDLDKNEVNDITVDHNKINISAKKNIGKIEFVSLKELSSLYFKPTDGSIIFMLNGEFLTDDLENYKIDKKYILSINILEKNTFKYLQKIPQNFKIVNVRTRTKENIKAASTIYIR